LPSRDHRPVEGKFKDYRQGFLSPASKFFSVRQTNDGGYAFSGQFYTGDGYYYGYNAWMVKTDSTGGVPWQKAYGNPNYAVSFQKVGLTSDGGLVAGGLLGDIRSSSTSRMRPTS
jgi:hypothetical protein